MTTKLTTEQFVIRANLKHNNKYDYTETVYTHSHSKVKIGCPTHGVFEQKADNHLKGSGCAKCGRESQAKSEFVSRSQEIHGDKYSYELVNYVHSNTPVNILCPIHGVFNMRPRNHIHQASGCPTCANEASGFTRTIFKDKCTKNNNGLGILYILGCFNDDKTEVFIKIGITSNSIKKRYCSKASMPYNFKILHEITGDPEFIYDLETKLHKKSKHYKYSPLTPFGGSSTECFKADKDYLSKLNTYMNELIPSF